MIDYLISRGWLKNGNSPGDLSKAPRCGAKTRSGALCRQPGMKRNGRCRLHGGKSPGAPRGERNGNYRHGLRTIEAIEQRREAGAVRRRLRALISEVEQSAAVE